MANQQLAKYIKEHTQKGYTLEQLRKVILDEGYTEKDIDEAAKSIQTIDNSRDDTGNTPPERDTKKHKYKYQHLKSPRYDQKPERPFWQYSIAILFLGIISLLIGRYPPVNSQLLRFLGYVLIFYGVFNPFLRLYGKVLFNMYRSLYGSLIDRTDKKPRNDNAHRTKVNEKVYFSSIKRILDENKNADEAISITEKTLSLKIIIAILGFVGISGLLEILFLIISASLDMSIFNIAVLSVSVLFSSLFLLSACGLWKMKRWAFNLSIILVGIHITLTYATPVNPKDIVNETIAKYIVMLIFMVISLYIYKNKKYYKL